MRHLTHIVELFINSVRLKEKGPQNLTNVNPDENLNFFDSVRNIRSDVVVLCGIHTFRRLS